jgi:hypothetical protein
VTSQPVVAFGQAVACRLFSHKSYIVVPKLTSSDDMNRLTSLCSIHGVGLVTFALNKDRPDYVVVVLPVNATPDMFYVNSMLERLKSSEPKVLNKTFEINPHSTRQPRCGATKALVRLKRSGVNAP